MACGTGSLTVELNNRGYDMTGLDLSAEMLSAASIKSIKSVKSTENSEKAEKSDILWINQDMCDFELYGTVDAVVCCFDSLNYVLDEKKIERCFALVYNYLNSGGLFIFDVNSEYKFEYLYGKNDIVLENGKVLCAWRNYYSKKSKICSFDLTLFVEQADGRYERYDEMQKEKYYSEDFFEDILKKNKFSDINIYYDFTANNNKNGQNIDSLKNKPARICFAALKK